MLERDIVFKETSVMLHSFGLKVIGKDDQRPWGGFFVIDESQSQAFIERFFPEEHVEELAVTTKLSPKILLVAPHARLSWQYHFRRAELWKCIRGQVGVATSDNDIETAQQTLSEGNSIRLRQGERHRLIGLSDWGIVAEIWQHTNPDHASDEDDIVRLQDDYGR